MAHRSEEKARRREERLAREEAERKAAARKRRLAVIAGVIAALAVAGAAVALVTGGGDGGGDGAGDGPRTEAKTTATVPPPEEGDYEKAAEAAGCTLEHPAIEGALHNPDKQFKPADYQSNPPHSGDHTPDWYDDGIYEPGDVPELGKLVHTLEHGRINIQYKPGTPANRVAQLEALYDEMEGGYHILLYENTTGMPYEVAATAWGHVLGCETFNDKVFDAIRTFRSRYLDKGPEQVP